MKTSAWWARVLSMVVLSASAVSPAEATGTYQTPESFLAEMFGGTVPPPQALWVQPEVGVQADAILGHDLGALRVRYWSQAGRFAWILEELGKEQPITVGIVTAADRIEQLRVLIFRESRGWEVRHPFFTDQFRGVGLDERRHLAPSIDGVSGATLSVSALTRLARLALLLHGAAAVGTQAPAP